MTKEDIELDTIMLSLLIKDNGGIIVIEVPSILAKAIDETVLDHFVIEGDLLILFIQFKDGMMKVCLPKEAYQYSMIMEK